MTTSVSNATPGAPTVEELHRLIRTFGPKIKIISEEKYLPTSVECFVNQCHLIHTGSGSCCHNVTHDTLPTGTESRNYVLKIGSTSARIADFSTAKAYVKAETIDDTYTDLQFWVFCAFRAPVTAKVTNLCARKSPLEIPLVAEKEGHWEHVILRFNNADMTQPQSVYVKQNGSCGWISYSECSSYDKQIILLYSSVKGLSLTPMERLSTTRTYRNVFGDDIKIDLSSNAMSYPVQIFDCSAKYIIIEAAFLGSDAPVVPNWVKYKGMYGSESKTGDARHRDIHREVQNYVNPWPKQLPRMFRQYDGHVPIFKSVLTFERITFKSASDELIVLAERTRGSTGPSHSEERTIRGALAA